MNTDKPSSEEDYGRPPKWHVEYLQDREKAIANGEDSFITLEAFEEEMRYELTVLED